MSSTIHPVGKSSAPPPSCHWPAWHRSWDGTTGWL